MVTPNGDLTRRAVLAGAVAMPWLVACGPGQDEPPLGLGQDKPQLDLNQDRARPDQVQDRPQLDLDQDKPGLDLEDGTFSSRFWPEREVRWRLARPDRHGAGAPQPLVVALHDHGGNADAPFTRAHIERHVVPTGLAVASVDGGNFYWHARKSGIDTGRMVIRDFLPLLARRGLATDRVGLLGWSMGGYGALHLAGTLGPRRVAGVVAVSAALWLSPGDSAEGAFDDHEDFVRNDVFAARDKLRGIPVRLDCGRDDPFIEAGRAFARELPHAAVTFDDGAHTREYWRTHAGSQMRWLHNQFH